MNSSFASSDVLDTESPTLIRTEPQAQQVSAVAHTSCRPSPTTRIRVIGELMQSAERRGDKDEARRYWKEMQALIRERAAPADDGVGYFDAEGVRIRAEMDGARG